MTDKSKSAPKDEKAVSAKPSNDKAAPNVSVLKIPAQSESGSAAKKASVKNTVKKTGQAKSKTVKGKVAKPQKKVKSVETKPAETKNRTNQTATGNTTKEKTMAKNSASSNNLNIPFDNLSKEAAEISREYSEACVKSGTILMKGMEDFVGVVMSLAQSSAEKQAQFIKEAMSSKTINEFAEVQNKIAQSNFDDFMAGATKLTEISTKLITESAEPVNAQIGKAIKKASESMAA